MAGLTELGTSFRLGQYRHSDTYLAHELYGFLAQGSAAEQDYSAVSTLIQDAANFTVATGRPRSS